MNDFVLTSAKGQSVLRSVSRGNLSNKQKRSNSLSLKR